MRLFTWVRLPEAGTVLAGELATTDADSQGRFEAEFEYAPGWLEHGGGFDLDPASLPRGARGARYRAHGFVPPLGIFNDALPDAWGRRILRLKIAPGADRSDPALLAALGAGGLGAMAFGPHAKAPVPPNTSPTESLPELLDAAGALERGELPDDHHFRRLLDGPTPGGARPKALVHDADGEWIAKFASRDDGAHDVVGLEAACMRMARVARIQVPATRLARIGPRRALLVERFDVTPPGGRRHMVSFRLLMKESHGRQAIAYGELADALRRHSANPVEDLARLFRQMTFNAAIGNVDDHSRNFAMVRDVDGWRLSPAFDLLPDHVGRREHALAFLRGYHCPGRADLVEVARQWNVVRAPAIIDEVAAAASEFRRACVELEVGGGESRDRIALDIDRRIAALGVSS